MRQVGFDGTEQLPTIAAASAAASTTCAVMGVCVSEVADNGLASVLIDGSFNGIDTSSFSAVNDIVYLSDTAGEISTVAGTEEKLVGRVLVVGTEGSISLVETLGGSGGGGGGGFFTDATGTNAGIGKGASAPTAGGANSLAQGDSSSAAGDNSFASGTNASAGGDNSFALGTNVSASSNQAAVIGQYATASGINSFAHGYYAYSSGNYSFASGYNVQVSGGESFGQGRYVTVQSNYSFAQGYSLDVDDTASFAQGYDIFIGPGDTNNLAQGTNIYIASSENVIGQGQGIDIIYGYQLFAQGYEIDGSSTVGSPDFRRNVFAQGYYLTIENGTQNIFMQGAYVDVDGTNVMVQGNQSSWAGGGQENVFAQGYNNDFTGSFACYQVFIQGRDNSTGGETTDIFLQGSYNTVASNGIARGFAQGRNAVIRQDDQKVWGSNRGNQGEAQVSHVVRYLSTADATTATLATIATEEDTTYAIQCLVVARNENTSTENASFVLAQATAYNNSGSLFLVGTPAFTSANSGGGSAAWACDIDVSGSDVRIRITGDAVDDVHWCCDLHFVEVFSQNIV